MDLPQTEGGCGWRGTHGTRRPGAPSRQAAGPAPFYMLGETGIPFLLIKKKKTIYLFLPVLGLYCYTWAFFSCGKQGLFFVVVCRLLTAVASLVEHGLSSTGSVVVGYGLSCSMACGIFPD